VGRTTWNGCGFSKDGEYVIGGAGHKAAHNVYIWDKSTGALTKILEGPKDPLEDLDVRETPFSVRCRKDIDVHSQSQWHPIRPVIASVSNLGLIHVWVTGVTENWSAYAPGFEELDENIEYFEREDEFDIVRLYACPFPSFPLTRALLWVFLGGRIGRPTSDRGRARSAGRHPPSLRARRCIWGRRMGRRRGGRR
jgi:hypothetical protein